MTVASVGSSAGAGKGATDVLGTVRGVVVDLCMTLGAARRVALACENGKRPFAADLATLGIPADGLPPRW